MGITVLGPLTVDGSGSLSRRDRVVLESLATRPGQAVSADLLADALWGSEEQPASRNKILQGCVVRLRKLLGPDAIETSPNGYILRLPEDQIDAARFERQVIRARELLMVGEPDRAAYLLTEALTLWGGDPFDDLDDWEPALTAARRLRELRLEAEELRLDALLQVGRYREVLAEAQAMVRAAPLREQRWALLARAQYQSGQQGEALRTIHQLKALLVRELAIDPDADVLALEESILRQDPSLSASAGTAPAASATCPWQGLRPYDVADADRFFGRDLEVAACLDIIRRASILALVGPSGSGKSSLLRAGVAAALEAGGQQSVTITPGPRPLLALSALDRARPGTALLVDQFEEVFSLCHDPRERQEFLDTLADAATRRVVAVALRADRLADLSAHPSASRLLERGLYLVGGLDEDGLRAAIEGPARQSGLVVEPGLVDLLVAEVREDPGALPLLSHALLETWKRREGSTLTVDGYRASGGIRGAVAQSAERLYAGVDATQRELLRDLLLRLVSPGPHGEPVRARVPRRLLTAEPQYATLVELLVGARLVTSDDHVLEITHEALARAWPRLRGWLEDDLEGQRILHHLASAADAWDGLGRPDSELYRGVRLARALDWRARSRAGLTGTERDFLEASRQRAEAEEQTAAERARAQARMIRRLRIDLAGAAVLLVLALAAGALAAVQSVRAGDNAAEASAAETRAVARQAGARALVSGDVDESLLLAVAGVSLADSPETRSNLLAALSRFPALVTSAPLRENRAVTSLATGPGGRTLATLDDLHTVRLHDAADGAVLASRQVGPPGETSLQLDRAMEFSPDGRWLAVAATPLLGAPLALLDATTLEPAPQRLAGLPRRGWVTTDVAFSADSGHLAASIARWTGPRSTVESSRDVLVWDVASPGEPWRLRVPGATGPTSVALSPDGRVLFTGAPLTRHVLATGESTELPAYAVDLAMSPDGRFLAATEGGFGALLLDGRTGRLLERLDHPTAVDVRFSRDGRTLATIGNRSRDVRTWRVGGVGASQLDEVQLDPGVADSVDLFPDGSALVSASGGESLRTWDLTGDHRFLPRRQPSPGEYGFFGTVSPGGGHLAQITGDGLVFVDLGTGERSPAVPFGEGYRHTIGTWHPDGRHYATAVGSRIRVWDITTGARAAGTAYPSKEISEIDFSPDGSTFTVAERTGRVALLDAETLRPLGKRVDVGDDVSWVQLRPDNTTAVVLVGGPGASSVLQEASTSWALVDLDAGRVVREGPLDVRAGLWLAVSPDGRFAAVGGGDSNDLATFSGTQGWLVVIDLESGQPVGGPVVAHEGATYQVAWSPDGSRIVSSGLDGTVAVWAAGDVDELARVSLRGAPLVGAEFLPDGESVRIVEWDSGTAYTLSLDPDRAVAFACRAVGRSFTADEWREHFGTRPYVEVCDL